MAGTENRGGRPERGRGANRRRPTQAQSLARQRRIAVARDVDHKSWAEIASEVEMGEKEVRDAYQRYQTEIAPIFAIESGMDRAHTYLQMLGDVRTRLFVIADSGDNDSARVGALREAAKCIAREIQLSQSLGLIPARVDDGAVSEDVRWLVQQLAQLLRRHRVPPAVIDEAGPKWVGSAASLEEITVHLLTVFIDGHLAVVRIRRQPIFPLYVP